MTIKQETELKEEITIGNKYIKKIKKRLTEKNKNWLCLCCGETGSGKSYSAISLANKISKNVFVVFNPVDFLKLLNSDQIQRGDAVIFDEAGVGMASRDWYSIQNKLLGSVLQTFRSMNLAVIFTTPNISFIDVQARKLFHCYLFTDHIDYKNNLAYLKIFELKNMYLLDKIYFKSPRFINSEGVLCKVNTLILDKPPEDKIRDYEILKAEFNRSVNEKALKDIQNAEIEKINKEYKIKDFMNKNKTEAYYE